MENNTIDNQENKPYDSETDTKAHILLVKILINKFLTEMQRRSNVHDASKLLSPEKELFDIYTPILKNLKYASENGSQDISQEYKESLLKLKPALDHHYANNSHHPEHYPNGINGFDLFDLVEMFCDWMAATKRTKDGNILNSIQINKKRFNMSDQLVDIFTNTVKHYNTI